MSTAPSVLLLDDGELDRIADLLRDMGVDFVHRRGLQTREREELPRDLLITSLDRALGLPELTCSDPEPPRPVRVCVHRQDFLPLRERLRALGIHYLVHSQVDPATLRLMLVQLLFRGDEQREALRLPLGREVGVRTADARSKAMLCELSRESCRMVSAQAIPGDTPLHLELPRELAGAGPLELSGVAVRSTACQLGHEGSGFQVVVQFAELDHDARVFLDGVFGGKRLGTPVTPLEPAPPRAPAPPQPEEPAALSPSEPVALLSEPDPAERYDEIVLDRRGDPRRRYARNIAALTSHSSDAPKLVLGRDLSASGICIAHHPSVAVGMHLAIAIYGCDGAEPLVVGADVIRDDGSGGLGLRFEPLRDEQRERLDAILSELPALEELGSESRKGRESDRVWVSKVLD